MMRTNPITAAVTMTAALAPLTALAAPAAFAASATKTYKGPAVSIQYGTVQVSIKVKGKKVVAISATAPNGEAKSMFINQAAVPLLRKEALKAQSASINAVSGATLTSGAFVSSLKAALKHAHV